MDNGEKMIKQSTLALSFIILFSNNLFAYNVNNECEKKLNKGQTWVVG